MIMEHAAIITVSVFLIVLGSYLVHKYTKKDSIVKRLGSVLLIMAGLSAIWSTAASNTSVLIHPRVEVAELGEGWIVTTIEYEPIRDCKLSGVSAKAMAGTQAWELEALFLKTKSEDINKTRGYALVLDNNYTHPDQLVITSKHVCPFGFVIETEFPVVSSVKSLPPTALNGP